MKDRHGVDWQRRVALMSIDDSEWAELAGMTTVRQPTYTIGERAVEFLHERIEGAGVAARECLLPGELMVRASTDNGGTLFPGKFNKRQDFARGTPHPYHAHK